MKTIAISKAINVKWLTAELQAAGVRVDSVGQENELDAYAEIHDEDESIALTVIEAHDPEDNPAIHERNNLAGMYNDIEAELLWLDGAISRVAQLKAVFDNSNSTQAQVKNAASGLAELLDRVLREQKREFKDGWKYVARRLK